MSHAIAAPRGNASFFSRLWLFWMAVLYVTLLLGLFSTYSEMPDRLQGWSGIVVTGAISIFLINYHLIYRPSRFVWPMPYRQALIYFSVQAGMCVILLHVHQSFVGIGFVLLGQVFGSLPPRRWALLSTCMAAIIAASIDLYTQVLQGDWLALTSFLLMMAILVTIGLMLSALFQQGHALRQLVGELSTAKADLEATAILTEELAALRERARLAREMHDSIGHALVLVNVKLEAAERIYLRDAVRGAAELEATRALVRETMADLRRSLANLRAPLTENQQLPDALRQVASDIQAHSHLAVALNLSTALPSLPTETCEALWRVAREALRNAAEHAAATTATIDLEYHATALILRISDDGIGIDATNTVPPGHYGIIGMRERIESLGGSFRMAERVGGGTLVEARLPMHKERGSYAPTNSDIDC